MPEGEGTVLDNSLIMFLSNMWAGWKHDNMKVPVVMAGGLGGHAPDRPARSTTSMQATRIVSCAAFTSESWTVWASICHALAMPNHG